MLNTILFIGQIGGMEWIMIFAGVLLLFGGKKIPELMRGVGKGIREFNDAREKVKTNLEEGMHRQETTAPTKTDNN
ncbi:MAG: twin-arginine translocase TatA/TatE family subunit [Bacteroidota bacterium]|nr:twin-arginine translocase TatA/TatE family subunit [Bacteroidota bacterium]